MNVSPSVTSAVRCAAVRDDAKPADAKGEANSTRSCRHLHQLLSFRGVNPCDLWPLDAARRVFVAESEASNFFKRRSRRSPKYYAELVGKLCPLQKKVPFLTKAGSHLIQTRLRIKVFSAAGLACSTFLWIFWWPRSGRWCGLDTGFAQRPTPKKMWVFPQVLVARFIYKEN